MGGYINLQNWKKYLPIYLDQQYHQGWNHRTTKFPHILIELCGKKHNRVQCALKIIRKIIHYSEIFLIRKSWRSHDTSKPGRVSKKGENIFFFNKAFLRVKILECTFVMQCNIKFRYLGRFQVLGLILQAQAPAKL